VYFKGFFEDQEFNSCESLLGTLMLLLSKVISASKENLIDYSGILVVSLLRVFSP
jgi:hypothetical protein